MAGFITRGQPAAVRQLSAMTAAGLPHALLLVGPRSVGKTTLALDIAAAQLCLAADPADRPCRECRGCRLVADGNHPDVHRLAPDGPGLQIRVEPVQSLLRDLAFLPVEGGARIAILEAGHRLNEDAQNVLLKTLEEPPAEVTIVICADDEARLLPTIHSRVARIRLGTVAPREIEALLGERGEADAPTANRLARLAAGRPGLAVAYARAPTAAAIRDELARSLLDLTAASVAIRLARIRELLSRAKELRSALVATEAQPIAEQPRLRGRGRGTSKIARAQSPGIATGGPGPSGDPADASAGITAAANAAVAGEPQADAGTAASSRATAADRRRDAALLLDIWRDVARDLAVIALDEPSAVHDPDLLEEVAALARRLPRGSIGAFLGRLDTAGRALDVNASPELVADVLALAWPRPTVAA